MTTLFKALDPGGKCRNGGSGSWHLPKGNRPGKWMPRVPNPVACLRGYHVCTALQLLSGNWLGPEIWIVEVRGASDLSEDDKSCHEQARIVAPTYWHETTARLFAADCAEQVLPIFEHLRPDDDRPRKCIAAARRFAVGEATRADRDAAGAAARDAAWDAAWDAAGAAAWAAAGDAAWAAAGDAARDAAWAAARAAARAAAGDAAGDAAWAAAGDAAGDAARDAAWDAARCWQARRLLSYLTGARGRKYAEGSDR